MHIISADKHGPVSIWIHINIWLYHTFKSSSNQQAIIRVKLYWQGGYVEIHNFVGFFGGYAIERFKNGLVNYKTNTSVVMANLQANYNSNIGEPVS